MGEIDSKPDPNGPRFQFGIRGLLVVTTVLAALLGVLKWAGAPPGAIAAIALLIGIEFVVALMLVFSLGKNSLHDQADCDSLGQRCAMPQPPTEMDQTTADDDEN